MFITGTKTAITFSPRTVIFYTHSSVISHLYRHTLHTNYATKEAQSGHDLMHFQFDDPVAIYRCRLVKTNQSHASSAPVDLFTLTAHSEKPQATPQKQHKAVPNRQVQFKVLLFPSACNLKMHDKRLWRNYGDELGDNWMNLRIPLMPPSVKKSEKTRLKDSCLFTFAPEKPQGLSRLSQAQARWTPKGPPKREKTCNFEAKKEDFKSKHHNKPQYRFTFLNFLQYSPKPYLLLHPQLLQNAELKVSRAICTQRRCFWRRDAVFFFFATMRPPNTTLALEHGPIRAFCREMLHCRYTLHGSGQKRRLNIRSEGAGVF